MGVDVVDRAVQPLDGLAHAGDGAFTRGCDHVGAVAGGAEAHHLAQDGGAARLGVLQAFQHHGAAAAGDDEAVTVGVVGAGGLLGLVVALAGHGPHAVEQHRHAPAQLFATAGEHHVLHAPGDLLRRRADAVRRGRTGRGDGVVDALDAEVRGQAGRHGGAHAARDLVRPDAADALAAQRVGGLDLVGRRAAARAHDEAGARVRHLRRRQAGLGDGVFQRDVGVGRGVAHEAQLLAVDARFQVDLGLAAHLAAQALLGELGHGAYAAPALAQRLLHSRQIVADAGNDARAGDDHPPLHDAASRMNRPTRRSLAT